MKLMKRAFGKFHKFYMKMTVTVRFFLSNDPLKWEFYRLQNGQNQQEKVCGSFCQ